MLYDEQVAATYDAHFTRPVDRWEDDRLAELLRPYVDDCSVLDLGCGTGWILDRCAPGPYVGVDASRKMLDVLEGKHPGAQTHAVMVGPRGWQEELELPHPPDTIVATWAAHEFGHLRPLLRELAEIVDRPGHIILHGQGPRYRRRPHYVLNDRDRDANYLRFTTRALRAACPPDGHLKWIRGTGALPDRLSRSRAVWEAVAGLPARCHYAYAACWELQ